MFLSSFLCAALALAVILGPEPWWAPRFSIPLLGMLLGNTMNGVSLSTERLTESVVRSREVIEQRLALGQSREEAVSGIVRESARAGLIPIFNAMAAAGVVSLPGMMTGQILAGAPVGEAVRYQILIILLIAAGTASGCSRRCGWSPGACSTTGTDCASTVSPDDLRDERRPQRSAREQTPRVPLPAGTLRDPRGSEGGRLAPGSAARAVSGLAARPPAGREGICRAAGACVERSFPRAAMGYCPLRRIPTG